MKTVIISSLIVLLFITCSKENNGFKQKNATTGSSSVFSNALKIPLNDLGAGTYMDSTGGLYPGGANVPSGIYANDLFQISGSIIPVDTFGNPAAAGKIAWISLGASIGGKNMKALITKTASNPATNPALLLMNGNEGGAFSSLSMIMDPHDPYWQHVTDVIARNSSYRQIQVVYLETDDGITTKNFPERPNEVKAKIEACAHTIKQKFANVKVLYLLGRTRTFNNKSNSATPWNTEPSPYYFGWACKWAIQDQINGVSGTEYKGANVAAPIMAWGFYQWADSLPRTTDNFYWRSTETKDGLHSNTNGEDTLATRFQNFLLSDINAKRWYAKP